MFLSSPGDCAAERAMLARVVRRVSESGEAHAAGIELKPLLFEELPPGHGAPGNVQLRINELLERYDLHRYEIYAGAMKHRIGTPTAKYASGTIEELETAVAGNRKSRVPAEVLFYFIDPENAPAEVRAFREQLNARGYLSASVRDARELEQQFEMHLTRIVTEWSLWGNRLRRGARRARPAVAAFLALLAIVLFALYLRFDRGGAMRVERALATRPPAEALAAYERERPYLFVHRRSTRNAVRQKLAREVRNGARNDPNGAEAAALWQRMQRAGVWSGAEDESRRLLRELAARRMIVALVADGVAVAEWPRHLREFERTALRAFAAEAARDASLAKWSRAERNAACVLAQAWPRLAEFAAEDVAAKELLVRHAPAEFAARWIAERVTAETGDPDVHAIVLAAEQRRDPAIVSALLERLQSGAIAPDVHGDNVLRALRRVAAAFAPFATEHLQRVDAGRVPELCPLLLAIAPAAALSRDELLEMVRPVLNGTASSDYEIAVYRAIAARGEWRARGFLLRRHDELSRDFLGIAQKAALIDALAATEVAGFPEKALALAKSARRDAEEVGTRDWTVQAAYLRALSRNPETWDRHASYVRALFARRAAEPGDEDSGVEAAAARLVAKLSAPQIAALLALPSVVIVDDGQWAPRWYTFRALSDSKSNVGTTVLANQYLRDPVRGARYLELLADANAESFFRERIAAGDANALSAASGLPDESRCRVFALAVPRFGASHAAQLWSAAARCGIANDALVAAAVREVKSGASDTSAMRYLAAVGREPLVLDDAAKILRAAQPFEWFALADAIPARACREPRIESLLASRALLRVTDGRVSDTLTAGDRSLSNPLLAGYAARADEGTARRLLEWSRAARVDTIVEEREVQTLWRAYCLWLAAPAARHLTPAVLDEDYEVTSLLAQNNWPLLRAAAAVCLGAT